MALSRHVSWTACSWRIGPGESPLSTARWGCSPCTWAYAHQPPASSAVPDKVRDLTTHLVPQQFPHRLQEYRRPGGAIPLAGDDAEDRTRLTLFPSAEEGPNAVKGLVHAQSVEIELGLYGGAMESLYESRWKRLGWPSFAHEESLPLRQSLHIANPLRRAPHMVTKALDPHEVVARVQALKDHRRSDHDDVDR